MLPASFKTALSSAATFTPWVRWSDGHLRGTLYRRLDSTTVIESTTPSEALIITTALASVAEGGGSTLTLTPGYTHRRFFVQVSQWRSH